MKNRIKKIGVLCFWPFPEGMAPTTRILAYGKGLVKNGVDVEIVSFNRIFIDDVKKTGIKKSGIIHNISYIYPHFFQKNGKVNKLIRGVDEIVLRLKVLSYFFVSNMKKSFDCVFFSFDDINSLSVYTRLLKPLKIPIVQVVDEYPIPIRDFNQSVVPDSYIKKYKKYHQNITLRIVMTKALETFYNTQISFKPTFLLNTIVDIDRFKEIKPPQNHNKYICYMGNMDLLKDNIDNIIMAFSLIADQIPDVNLFLFGSPNLKDKNFLEKIISEKQLQNRVFLKGQIRNDEVPEVLSNSYILVSSQPISKRAEGGFPTKLGEYLLSGKPSIFTDAGEIQNWIKDGESGFIVERNNPRAFAEKIMIIINDYSKAMKVAENGRKLIQDNFGAEKIAAELLLFLNLHLSKT